MESFLDIVMILLFIIFMVFILGGYHRTKYAQRDEELNPDDIKKSKEGKGDS